MLIIDQLKERKNQFIYGFLKGLDEHNLDKDIHNNIRVKFLDIINTFYRETVYVIAAQEGIILQSTEALAKQMLPKNFSIENIVDSTKSKLDETKKKPVKVKEVVKT